MVRYSLLTIDRAASLAGYSKAANFLMVVLTDAALIFCYDARLLCRRVYWLMHADANNKLFTIFFMLNKIRIVMVETQTPGNIGAAARAMLTMGLTRLVLVNPQEFPAQKAIWRAAGATSILENAQVVSTLNEAIEGCALVIAASARQRRIPWPMLSPEQAGQKAMQVAKTSEVAFVFGREDRGLINEELQLCNFHSAIPANEDYPVLNVAAAVQVFVYEIRKSMLALTTEKSIDNKDETIPASLENWDVDFATYENIELFYEHLERVLIDVDFHKPENPRQLMTRLRRLFNRAQLDVMELNILRGILTAIEKARK